MSSNSLTQFATLYQDARRAESDVRRLWDSDCPGADRFYETRTGDDQGWRYARRIQIGRCKFGAVCLYITDYLHRGPVVLVLVLGEAGKSEAQWRGQDRRRLISEADNVRRLLLDRMTL